MAANSVFITVSKQYKEWFSRPTRRRHGRNLITFYFGIINPCRLSDVYSHDVRSPSRWLDLFEFQFERYSYSKMYWTCSSFPKDDIEKLVIYVRVVFCIWHIKNKTNTNLDNRQDNNIHDKRQNGQCAVSAKSLFVASWHWVVFILILITADSMIVTITVIQM